MYKESDYTAQPPHLALAFQIVENAVPCFEYFMQFLRRSRRQNFDKVANSDCCYHLRLLNYCFTPCNLSRIVCTCQTIPDCQTISCYPTCDRVIQKLQHENCALITEARVDEYLYSLGSSHLLLAWFLLRWNHTNASLANLRGNCQKAKKVYKLKASSPSLMVVRGNEIKLSHT